MSRNTEAEVARRINEISEGRLDYVSGYTVKEAVVRVHCKVCGETFERTYHHLTTSGYGCPECLKREKEKAKADRTAQRERERNKRKRIAEVNKISRYKQMRMVSCPVCGEMFLSWNSRSVYCSEKCRKKSIANTQSSDDRLNRSNIIDKGITLKKLYDRDGGVCQICGGVCDWNDCRQNENGVFIAGDLYPSKDHVIPLSCGGKHSWDNVRLAHRLCNTKNFWKK